MKKVLFLITFALASVSSFGKTSSDTISISQNDISRFVADTTFTSTGKQTIKYYCIYKGQLIASNKTTIQNVELCNRFKVKCSLILITSSTGRKRIVCN